MKQPQFWVVEFKFEVGHKFTKQSARADTVEDAKGIVESLHVLCGLSAHKTEFLDVTTVYYHKKQG